MADFKAGARKAQGEAGTSHCTRQHENAQRMTGKCQKDKGSSLKVLPRSVLEQYERSRVTEMDCNFE